MAPHLCSGAGVFEFHDACVRSSWAALLPTSLVLAYCLFSIPVPGPARPLVAAIRAPFKTFLSLPEAEALQDTSADQKSVNAAVADDAAAARAPVWRTIVFAWAGLLQTLAWVGFGAFLLIQSPRDVWRGVLPILNALPWLYTTVRAIARPTGTPPFDLFFVYVANLFGAILQVGGIVYDINVFGAPLPPTLVLAGQITNLVVVVLLLLLVFSMPLAIPSARVNKEDIGNTVSPEDYTSLFGWVTFAWVYPLIKRGKHTTLSEKDVWSLSPTYQSRPLFIKFSRIQGFGLLRRLWATNSLDLIIDFVFTIVGVVFNYAGPFFLKRILDAIDVKESTPETRAQAYIYAFLAFFCALARSQSDLQHLWFGRRAGTRIRSELMAAIYDKALRRKDFSGIVKDKEVAEKPKDPSVPVSAADKSKAKAATAKADDPKAGADIGKIVNLMSGDATKIAGVAVSNTMLYAAPFEVLFATIFLYQLLGMSAFAGYLVLVAGWPLNNFVMRRSVRIQKGVLAARDKRMGVLNELISAVKFIKFFAWEEKWIQRTLEAREVEMQWLVKSRINSVLFQFLWTSSPILVSIISFFAYVASGQELTVSTAFTSLALFSMIRAPLNIIPAWIVQLMQAEISLKRIAVYLNEDEVTEQVSSLKKDESEQHVAEPVDEGLGLENASLKWNEVEKVDESADGKKKSGHASASTTTLSESSTLVGSAVGDVLPADAAEHRFELHDISVKFPEGELTVITGPTASGKTALLLALLGEMTLLSGRLIMSKSSSKVDGHGLVYAISYAAQSPWLQHRSIKENILFGTPFDEERYNAVVEACALKPDLEVLEDGDGTEIGARGVTLSGGQKARVALARAVYAHTKYVLLDDPLSAVDSHTSRFLFEKLFQGPLLANRTVILVTHHVELVLPGTYYLVRMLDGRIDTQGTVKELRAQGALDAIAEDSAVAVKEEEIAAPKPAAAAGEDAATKPIEDKKARKLVQDEHREVGGVKWKIYKTYLKASSYYIWIFLAFLVILTQLVGITEKLWIKTWGEAYDDDASSVYGFSYSTAANHETAMDQQLSSHSYLTGTYYPFSVKKGTFGIEWPNAHDHPLFYIGVYALIGLTTVLITMCSSISQFTGALWASRTLFNKLLTGVVRATMRWHDITPQGRMLNRFSKDIETIDTSLATALQTTNSTLASFFAAVITVAVVFPAFLIPAFFLGFIYRELAVGYLRTGRDLRRMESNSRSPIFSDFGELLEGIVTVRAFSVERRFLDNLHIKIDNTTKMWYSFWNTNRWLLYNFDVLGATSVLVTTLLALSGFVSAGIAGLCITSAMSFTTSIYWACRYWTELELALNSVERVVEYLDLPQEPPAVIESNRPPAYWPSSNTNNPLLSVEDLVIKYAPELPPVLHGVSFDLKAKERVGLLGRTGSGKSTLATSILRFVEPASGRILIDGIDISTIGIHDLRTRLTFIPQDATLFSGSLRDNLDPFKEHEDSECLDVLHRVHLVSESAAASQRTSRNPSRAPSIHEGDRDAQSVISVTPTDTDTKLSITLDTQVSAGGTNFSQGQRQLIAMARALLRRSSIIVLDEATSSIDFATDAKIQTTIREEFGDSLLLTVAHRLRTVIDYDRLIVLDKGQVAEFDTPYNLIQKEGGIFRNMCLNSGTFGELEAAAKAKADSLK